MSIGSQLRQARDKKGVSLQEASAKTKIQEKFLDALEKDDFSALPNSLYLKGFLKKYAEFLGLAPDVIALQIEASGLEKEEQVIVLGHKENRPMRRSWPLKNIYLLLIVISVIIGISLFLSLFLRKDARTVKKQPAAMKLQQKKIKKPAVTVSMPSLEKPKTKIQTGQEITEPQPVINVPIVLSVIAKRPCRLSLKADNRLLFEGFLLSGTTDQWKAKNMFELSVSDASALELVVNGKKVSSTANAAKRDIIITKDGIRRK